MEPVLGSIASSVSSLPAAPLLTSLLGSLGSTIRLSSGRSVKAQDTSNPSSGISSRLTSNWRQEQED